MDAIDLRPQSELSPLAERALAIYREHAQFDEEALEALQKGFDDLCDDANGLFWAIAGLVGVARLLKQQGDPVACEQLTLLLEAQVGRYPKLDEAVAGHMQDRAAQLMSGGAIGAKAAIKRAPMHGVGPPPGTTRLSTLIPPHVTQAPRNKR